MNGCEACSECSQPRSHREPHDCDCADRWTPPTPPADWLEKAEASRAAWVALSTSEHEELLLGIRWDDEGGVA